MAGDWQRLGDAAGTERVGVNRIRIEPGRLSTPPHSHGASEEIFFVLGGSGLSWQDEQVYEVGPGDCIVHQADHEEHTLRGGARRARGARLRHAASRPSSAGCPARARSGSAGRGSRGAPTIRGRSRRRPSRSRSASRRRARRTSSTSTTLRPRKDWPGATSRRPVRSGPASACCGWSRDRWAPRRTAIRPRKRCS